MSQLSRRSLLTRVSLVVLLVIVCLGASLWLNKLYRQPLNPVSMAAITLEEEPVILPEDLWLELTAVPEPFLAPANLATIDAETALQAEVTPTSTPKPTAAATIAATLTPQTSITPTATISPTATSITDQERINILLMGSDSRVGAIVSRTDTMMLISVNTQDQTVSLLSIPRDLYVDIPGYGKDRLNSAFIRGADAGGGDPAAGAAIVMQTIEDALGVPVDHYILVNLRAVEKTINALGGVDIYVPNTIDDPTYLNTDTGETLFIPAGQNHLDGGTALRYMRTRYQDNDFARANRQQLVLMALRQEVLNIGIAEMIQRMPLLYQNVKSGIFTDLSMENMVALAEVGSDIPTESINMAVLNSDYVTSFLTEEGAHVLLLIPEKADVLIQELFYGGSGPEPTSQAGE